jgi:hypothetical protein
MNKKSILIKGGMVAVVLVAIGSAISSLGQPLSSVAYSLDPKLCSTLTNENQPSNPMMRQVSIFDEQAQAFAICERNYLLDVRDCGLSFTDFSEEWSKCIGDASDRFAECVDMIYDFTN